MKTTPISDHDARKIVTQWGETGRLLARMRLDALASQLPDESRQAAWDMLQLGGMLAESAERVSSSGLIEMQRLFAQLRRRG